MPGFILKALVCTFVLSNVQTSFAQDNLLHATNDSVAVKKDVVKMKNGDQLTGAIIRVRKGQLYFKSDIPGEVTIDLRDISSLSGTKNVYQVAILNKGLYVGTLAEAAQKGDFSITQRADTTRFRIVDISWLRRYKNRFLQQLEGTFNFGYTYTKAGGFEPMNISNQLLYTTEKWKAHQTFSGIYPATDGEGFERMDAATDVRRMLNSRWMLVSHLQFQRIVELGVKARGLNITGVARRLVESRRVLLDAGTGFALQKEATTTRKVGSLQAELPVIFDFHLFQLKKPDLDIAATANFFYNLSVTDRFRVDYTMNVNYKIVADFTIGVQFYYNYDSRPLQQATEHADFGNVLTLGYRF